MLKRISQIILLLAVLLAVLGNTAKLGVCPCHSGIFLGDCACNLHQCEQSRSSSSDYCCDACRQADLAQQQNQNKDKPSSHCDGICDNATLKSTEPFIYDPPVKSPDYNHLTLLAAIPFEYEQDFILLLAGCESDNKLRPPPDLFTDGRQAYKGYMRPQLA